MLEVFFRGEGHWYDVDVGIRDGDITGGYQANGVFRLSDDDEIAYRHVGAD